jgi:hypothetical protein
MVIMKKNLFISVAAVFGLIVSLSAGPVSSAQEDTERDLPGYYEFFTKTGKLTRLTSEVKRDDAVKAGKITPVAMNEPLVDLKLPDGFGKMHGTRDYVGKQNLVLITGRAWW